MEIAQNSNNMAKITNTQKNAIETQDEELDSEVKKDLQKHEEKLENHDYKDLLDQIQTEKKIGWDFIKPKFDARLVSLMLYNNQKKDKMAVGDPLLFTIHQTVLASLYDDKLAVTFEGREEGDSEVASNLNSLAEFDYNEMQKAELDYDFDWDATFFGRALMMLLEFNRDKKCPAPEIIDIMTWIRDPRAISVNGDSRGRGAMRFGGREIALTKRELEESKLYSNIDINNSKYTDLNSLMDRARQARDDAQGRGNSTNKYDNIGNNTEIRGWEWFTWYNNRRVFVTLNNDMSKVMRFKELDDDKWPIIDRAIYPMAHDWDGVNIRDLVEDKQRGRARVENASLENIESNQRRMFLFNTTKITDPQQLANLEANKNVGVDGDISGSIQELQKTQVGQEVNWIMGVLDTAAQKATATPDIQQGAASKSNPTATELNFQKTGVDTRYSLSAKIFGWSEKRFWGQWYQLYKRHFENVIDEKTIRIKGVLGSTWRKLTKDNILASEDPDIIIESKAVSDAKKYNQLQNYKSWLKDVVSTDPKNSNIRFGIRREGELSGLTKEEVLQIIPESIDEMNAESENKKLDNGKLVEVQIYDDDFVHMQIHNKAAETNGKKAHILAHRKALILKKMNPQLGAPETTPETENMEGGSAPLKNNMLTPNQ